MRKEKMQIAFGLIAIVLLLLWHNSRNKTEQMNEIEPEFIEEVGEIIVDENKEFERVINKFELLYFELLELKDDPAFKEFGFGGGGPNSGWLNSIDRLEKDPYSKLLLRKTIAAGDLRTLAHEYVKTGGEENNITGDLNVYITSAFQIEEFSDIPDIKDESDYMLFGEWSIKNTIASSLNHKIEIFYKGSDYYSILTFKDGSSKREPLRKEGNRFFIIGNKSGDYYLISPRNKSMRLFDRLGELEMFVAERVE